MYPQGYMYPSLGTPALVYRYLYDGSNSLNFRFRLKGIFCISIINLYGQARSWIQSCSDLICDDITLGAVLAWDSYFALIALIVRRTQHPGYR